MEKLKKKIFLVMFAILTIFLVNILCIFNFQDYNHEKVEIENKLSRDFQKAGTEKPSAIPDKLLPAGQLLRSNNIITPAKINDNPPSTTTLRIFTKSPPGYWNLNPFSCHTRAIFYNIAFNIVIAKERSMFHYRASALLNLASYLIFSFRFRTYVFNLPKYFIRPWTIGILHFTSNFKIMWQIMLPHR